MNFDKHKERLNFIIDAEISGKLGRAGTIKTAHGEIKTPAFLAVGTYGVVRFLDMDGLRGTGAQAMLSNGYHLREKSFEIADGSGLAKWSGWNGPTVTDSGGFQVMSLGSGMGKVVAMEEEKIKHKRFFQHSENLVKISDSGVDFVDPFTGEPDFIDPEKSMQIQCRIGADIHMAFDELTSLADDYDYNVVALERTYAWAKRSLSEHQKQREILGYMQNLYGVLQGGRWEDLRRLAAQQLGEMDFDGFGLGGAFLKKDLGKILVWCNEELPKNKPRHLLGLSRPDDILIGAENGADTFDCVAPTREARHGKIYTRDGDINLRKFANSTEPLDTDCDCETCKAGWTRGKLRELWKSGDPELKKEYFRLASIHNLRFIVRLTEEIRESILNGNFTEYKESFLKRYYS